MYPNRRVMSLMDKILENNCEKKINFKVKQFSDK